MKGTLKEIDLGIFLAFSPPREEGFGLGVTILVQSCNQMIKTVGSRTDNLQFQFVFYTRFILNILIHPISINELDH